MEFIIGLVLRALEIGVVAVLVVDSIVLTKAYHYGVLERLGDRTGKIYFEGLGFKIPLFDRVKFISMAPLPINIEAFFTTGKLKKPGDKEDDEADKLQVDVTGSLQHAPDPFVIDDEGRNVYISMSEKIIKDGIQDKIRDLLGGLGGIYQAEDLIGNRQAFGDLIDQILKCAVPYHLRHKKGTVDKGETLKGLGNGGCGDENCRFEEQVPREELIEFYNSHWRYLKEEERRRKKEKNEKSRASRKTGAMSRKEVMAISKQNSNISPVEQRYGLHILTFANARVDFSKEVKAAFEQRKLAKERRKAFDVKLEMAEQAQSRIDDISGQEALNAADVSLIPEVAKGKSIVSVEGKLGVVGGLVKAVTN